MRRLLLIIEPQMEFIDGSLPVPGAAACMEALAEYIRNAKDNYVCRAVTTDCHPYNLCSFPESGCGWQMKIV